MDGGREWGKQCSGVTQQLGEHATGADHQHLAELSIDCHAYDDFSDTIGDHLLRRAIGRRAVRQPLRGGFRFGGCADVDYDGAELGFVFEVGA